MTNAELVALATKLGEEKQNSINLLKTLNPDLFSQKQPCKPFEILLAGREEVKRDLITFAPDPTGAKELTFVLLSRPSPAAVATGKIFVSDYLNASFEIAGGMKVITKETAVDQITVQENGTILYREATRIMEDGTELTKTYHRNSLTPDQDLTDVPEKVVAICNTAWTQDVIDAYKASLPKEPEAA